MAWNNGFYYLIGIDKFDFINKTIQNKKQPSEIFRRLYVIHLTTKIVYLYGAWKSFLYYILFSLFKGSKILIEPVFSPSRNLNSLPWLHNNGQFTQFFDFF